jgi:hypothetical protein
MTVSGNHPTCSALAAPAIGHGRALSRTADAPKRTRKQG